jgi:hypothetical protein
LATANDLSRALLYSLHYLAFQNHLQELCSPDFKFASTSSFNKTMVLLLTIASLFLTRDLTFFICFITFKWLDTVEYSGLSAMASIYQIEHSHQTILLFAVANECLSKTSLTLVLVSSQDYH